MPATSHQVVNDYFAAKNRKDLDAMLESFATDAVVQDEGATHRGHADIRAWMEETTRKYDDTAEPSTVKADNGRVEVAALVSGNFPGSPATLRFVFRVEAGRIAELEIGA